VDIVFAGGTYTLGTARTPPGGLRHRKIPDHLESRSRRQGRLVRRPGHPAKSGRKGDDGVWQVDLAGIGPDGWNFRQLFVDGKRAIRARFPNADAKNPFLYATGGDMDHAIIDPALVKESWGRARDAQINIVPQWRFFNQWNTVTKVDTTTGRIDIADSERHAKIIRATGSGSKA
jgi:hypothetical protein